MTYFLTFSCYGRHIHGQDQGSVDRNHNLFGSCVVESNRARAAFEQHLMDQPCYELDETRRKTVLTALVVRCPERGWRLLAAHVRSTHVHAIIRAEESPERVMNDLKSFASRILNRDGLDQPNRKRWARHGSTRWLWNRDDVGAAIHYVVEEQGRPMAVYLAGDGIS